jgi:hypothetical protein
MKEGVSSLNPEGSPVNMDALDGVLEEAAEIDDSSKEFGMIREILERLQSVEVALRDAGELGPLVDEKYQLIKSEIHRLQGILARVH